MKEIMKLEGKAIKSFQCKQCGFFFSLAADFKNMSEEEKAEISKCPCGARMEEVEFSEDMIPTIEV